MYRTALMVPEYLVAAILTTVLGWGGFTWRRAEHAVSLASNAADATDKLELKLAEKYLTKDEFEYQMDKLFRTLGRLEEKIDYHVFNQTQEVDRLRTKLRKYELD